MIDGYGIIWAVTWQNNTWKESFLARYYVPVVHIWDLKVIVDNVYIVVQNGDILMVDARNRQLLKVFSMSAVPHARSGMKIFDKCSVAVLGNYCHPQYSIIVMDKFKCRPEIKKNVHFVHVILPFKIIWHCIIEIKVKCQLFFFSMVVCINKFTVDQRFQRDAKFETLGVLDERIDLLLPDARYIIEHGEMLIVAYFVHPKVRQKI